MDLTTTYLGLKLPHPFLPGASPMVDDLDTVRRLEDAGAAALVLYSLFEEQIAHEEMAIFLHTETHGEAFAEAQSYFPDPGRLILGPNNYLEHLRRVKAAVSIPVIASLNGSSLGGWLRYAKELESAGADAIELNVYAMATDARPVSREIEDLEVQMVRTVKQSVKIPLAVKLSPFYTAFANFAQRLVEAGADGLVLFNRFYQPDIDIENLAVERTLHLSDSSELLLRLRWLAVLSGRVRTSYAVTGGVHTAEDAIKAIMAGADAVQMVSALLKHGPEYLRQVHDDLVHWAEEHDYHSLDQMRGSMNLETSPDPAAFERANYMLVLQGWR